MSLRPRPINDIPEQTVAVAKAAFPKGNVYMTMRDELGTFFTDETFADLFLDRGQPCSGYLRHPALLPLKSNLKYDLSEQ